tara:strand:+ start:18 stop:269 length:252 start_codon:yes stop_codon:yes gene_type:complete
MEMTNMNEMDELEDTLRDTAQQMRDIKSEMTDMTDMVLNFRKAYDELMDAVHYLSVMYGTEQEADAMNRLQIIYTKLQNTWGG